MLLGFVFDLSSDIKDAMYNLNTVLDSPWNSSNGLTHCTHSLKYVVKLENERGVKGTTQFKGFATLVLLSS